MNRFVRLIGSFFFIITLFILLYAYAMFQGGFVSWFLFFSFLPIGFYQIILMLYPLQRWEIKRTLSHHILRAGDSIKVSIKMNRKIPFPLFYCIVEEVVPQTLRKIDNRFDKYYYLNEPNKLVRHHKIKKVIFPLFRRQIEVQYELAQIPRGEHQLNLIKVRTGDVFGFIKKEVSYQITDELVAHPNQRSIKMNGKMARLNQGEQSAQLLFQKNTNVVSGVREYVPGDKFSWIDWKQTARNHVMMSKEFEQEKSSKVLLVLNACYNTDFNPIAFEAAIEMTLSFLMDLEKGESTVDFLAIGSNAVHFRKKDFTRGNEAIQQYLTRVQPGENHFFSEQLLKEFTEIGRQPFVIMITTHVDNAFFESVQKIGKQMDKLLMIYIQSEKRILQDEHDMLQELGSKGITTILLTERELVTNPIEVNL